MANMILTNVHFTAAQKKQLQQRAKARKSSVADEVRAAVDAYLSGVTKDELALLDAATLSAQAMLDEMVETLDGVNRRAAATFDELARLRGSAAESTA